MNIGKTETIMDTNVAIVANGTTGQASHRCVGECIAYLRLIRDERCVLLDDRSLILDEYRKHLSHSGQPGPGDAFFKWLFENQGNLEHCRMVALHLHPDRGFNEFPQDTDLISFDPADRKFVAVALASKTGPKIANASDTDWWLYHQKLQQHGVEVDFLCPELMQNRC